MKMKKNGFTLVELLAVIAILAILIVFALPNVIELFNNTKKSAFKTEVQSLMRTAQDNWMQEQLSNPGGKKYVNFVDDDICTLKNEYSSSTIPMKGTELSYYIELDVDGNIVKLTVFNSDYYVEASNTVGVKPESIEVTDGSYDTSKISGLGTCIAK